MAGVLPVSAARVHHLSGKDEKPSGKDEKQTHAMDVGPDHPELDAPVQSQPASAVSVARPVNLVAQRQIHNVSTDLLGCFNGINTLYYFEKAMRILHEKGVEPGSEKAKANKERAKKILKTLDFPIIPELRAKINAADIEGAKDLIRTLSLLHQAMNRLEHDYFERADRAIRKLGAYLVGDLEIAIRRGDYSAALVALEKGRNDVICLLDAFDAEDDEAAQAAVNRLGVEMFPELRAEIDAKNINNAIVVLENYRRDISKLQLAIKVMPDLARAQRAITSLGVYIVGDLKVALFARNLSQAKIALDGCRTDISHLKEAMLAIQPEEGRPLADMKRAKAAIGKLGVYLLGDLRKALEAGRLQIAAEALERARFDVACVTDAIHAIHPVDGSPSSPKTANAALAKIGFRLAGSLKTQIDARNLYEALKVIEAFREDRRKISYQIQGDRIGKGSYGKVYPATHPSSGMDVVIKTQDKDKTAEREAETFGVIQRNHVPHSVIPIEIFTSSPDKRNPHMNIVMPKHQVLPHGTTLPLDQLRSMAHQGVGYFTGMQKIGKSHNDIKPSNLSWEVGPQHLAIFDYGLSCSFDDPKLSQPNAVIGTRPYQAPEMLLGYPLTDNPMTDLWSWGCTLIELYLGEHLFPRDSDSIEAVRLHALSILDQIGHPSKEYLAKCDQARLKKIFALDADGNIEGVLQPHHPRWPNTSKWDERIREKGSNKGDDPVLVEDLIEHIRGLLDYADRRELRD
ncbi:MAG TPA: protein kinase, partial [Chlamydiales bacterium]|nr:protein kinase [Chlamydiales bacterium]